MLIERYSHSSYRETEKKIKLMRIVSAELLEAKNLNKQLSSILMKKIKFSLFSACYCEFTWNKKYDKKRDFLEEAALFSN